MKQSTKILFIIIAAFSLIFAANIDLLLANENDYQPGTGLPVGEVIEVYGDVVIIHAEAPAKYKAKKYFFLYKADTIETSQDGRIQFRLNDKSTLTLASGTTLTITKSVFDPDKQNRSSFINMSTGKARFYVKKLSEYRDPEFKVKTNTAILGVRGSNFIVEADEKDTEITALENTVLEVWSIIGLNREPTLLTDYEKSIVVAGELPTEPVSVPLDNIEQMIMEMIVVPEAGEEVQQPEKVEPQPEKVEPQPEKVEPQEPEERPAAEPVKEEIKVEPSEPAIKEELPVESSIQPVIERIEPIESPEHIEAAIDTELMAIPMPEIVIEDPSVEHEEMINEQQQEIVEKIVEEDVTGMLLPEGLPRPPQN